SNLSRRKVMFLKDLNISGRRLRCIVGAATFALALGFSEGHLFAQLSYSGSALSQNFNTLPAQPGTLNVPLSWTNNVTLPGWYLYGYTDAAITQIQENDGTQNAGSFYDFGSAGDGDRALGGIASANTYFGSPAPASGALAGWIAVGITNASGLVQNSFTMNYDGEQWRNGGNTSQASQTMVVEYGFGSTFASVSTWTAAGSAFNFTSPINTPTAGALNGNLAADRSANLGGQITGITWNTGDTLWIRWIENNDVGNDHGLAVDNFNF